MSVDSLHEYVLYTVYPRTGLPVLHCSSTGLLLLSTVQGGRWLLPCLAALSLVLLNGDSGSAPKISNFVRLPIHILQ